MALAKETMFGLFPTVAFLLACPLRLRILLRRDKRSRPHITRQIKLAIALVLIATKCALIVAQIVGSQSATRITVASSAINLAAAVGVLVLSWVEDERSVKPSSLLTVYLLFNLFMGLVQTRDSWYIYGNSLISNLSTMDVIFTAVMMILESLEKRKHLIDTYKDLPPESTSGMFNRWFIWWLNDLLLKGSGSLLTLKDLHHLDIALEPTKTARRGMLAWTQRQRPERRFEFSWQMIKTLKGSFALTIIPRLLLVAFTFSQPFIIKAILSWLDSSQSTTAYGKRLVGFTLIIYLGIALSKSIYDQMLYRFVTLFRGTVSLIIYDHALHIPDGALEDRSAIITLMTTDVDRMINCLITLDEIWARSIEVVIGIALLAHQLGWVCLIPLIIVLISSGGSYHISKNIGGRQKAWITAVQHRIAVTRSLLSGIMTVKAAGLSQTFIQLIQKERDTETHQMAKFRWILVWQNMVQNLPWALAPAVTFVIYAVQGNELHVAEAFSSLSIISLLTDPASKLLSAVPSIAAATGSFDRIQSFLLLRTESLHSDGDFVYTNESGVEAYSDIENVRHDSPSNSQQSNPVQRSVVSLEHVNIRPSPSANVVLRDVKLQIQSGVLVIIQGPIGSGKSTLLRAILGQATCYGGSMSVDSHELAFCAQTPWLPSGTIRDVICGPSTSITTTEFDKTWYATVLHACSLNQDLDLLSDGDATIIGHGSGQGLSGGQMHRIALARAVYSRKRLLLLDDVFSALDRKTRGIVMARLLGVDGLLRKINSVIILVTHEVDQLPAAFQLYTISDQRLCDETPADRNVYQLIRPDNVEGDGDQEPPDSGINHKASDISQGNEIDDLRRSSGDYAVYAYYLRHIGLAKASTFIFFVLLNVFASQYSQIWLKEWADRGGGQKGLFVPIYFILSICNTVGNGGYVWAILIMISPFTARRLHYVLLETFLMATPQFLGNIDIGSMLNRFSQDMTLIESDLPVGVLITVSNLFSSIASAALIAIGSTYMAISIPFLVIVVFLLQHFYLKTSRQLRLLDLESRSPLYSHLLDTVEGLATIQAFGWEEDFKHTASERLDVTQRATYMLNCIQRWLNLVLDLVVTAEAFIVVSLAIFLRHSTNVGLLGVSLNSILAFNGSLSSLISGWTQLEISLGSISRVKDFELTVPREGSTGQVKLPIYWPDRGLIQITGLEARYNSEKAVLSNLSLKCLPGQRIGLYGRTGCGKSSLLATLLGALTVTRGSIFIDNIDIATLAPDRVREKLVTIPQTPFIMVGCTIRCNLDPTGAFSDEKIIAALSRVGIWNGLLLERGGLDAEINDILSLSRGEQQLLQLARAMLKIQSSNSRILLIDEGTSSVDFETEAHVQSLLRQDPFRTCTILAVAHRVHAILSYDLVVGLDHGQVVEIGQPVILASQENSMFSSLLHGGEYSLSEVDEGEETLNQ